MANVTVAGASYVDVPAVELPVTGGGTAAFYETVSVTYNLSSNVAASIDPPKAVTGQGFSLRLDALNDYNLSEVVITMGGIDVTSQVFSGEYPDSGGGGSVTVTEEANATGITCVITTSSEPTPPEPEPGDIPLNTELIDYTATSSSTEIDEYGQAISADPWYYASDYTAIDPSMTFTFKGTLWGYIAVYDSSKTFVRSFMINDIADSTSGNTGTGTLSGSRITNGYYVRISAQGNTSGTLSLIRTA